MFTFARSLGNDIDEKQGRHLSLNGCLLFLTTTEGRCLCEETVVLTPIINNFSMQKRTYCKFVIISISAEVIRLFRIKVFTHVKFGKREREKSLLK